MTVRELLNRIDSAELTEWMAFDCIEPFGDPRADLRAGIVASAVANHGFRYPKEAAKPVDFMPFAKRARSEDPILLEDKRAHSALIAKTLFGGKGYG